MENRLTAEELDAIQAAISQSASRQGPQPAIDATAIPLIADDRAAERARPNGLRIGNRWAVMVRERLQRLTSSKVEVDVVGAETVEVSTLREELAAGWVRCIDIPGRPDPALMCATGPIIEALSAVLLGGRADGGSAIKRPSPAALRIFERAGKLLGETLHAAWREEQGCDIVASPDAARAERWRLETPEDSLIVVVTLSVGEPIAGVLRIVARPETFVAPPPPVEAIPAPDGAIEEAMGGVPVEVRVELGTLAMTMDQLLRLEPGTLLPLHKFIDDPLPVFCAGRIKAHGRALVTRGVMAVEITEVEA